MSSGHGLSATDARLLRFPLAFGSALVHVGIFDVAGDYQTVENALCDLAVQHPSCGSRHAGTAGTKGLLSHRTGDRINTSNEDE